MESPLPEYPLRHTWVAYMDQSFQNLTQVSSFDSISTFWRYFNNVPPCSQLKHQCSHRIFRQGIQPMSEDAQNIAGGMWTARVTDKTLTDAAALETVLATVGQTLSPDGDVNGVVIGGRRLDDRISLWTRYGGLDDRQQRLGRRLRELVPGAESIVFKLHQDSVKQRNHAFLAKEALKA